MPRMKSSPLHHIGSLMFRCFLFYTHPHTQTHPPNTTQRTVLSTLLTICMSGCIIHGDAPINSSQTHTPLIFYFCAFLCFASFQAPIPSLIWLLLYFIHQQLPVISAHMCSLVCQYFYFLRTLFYSRMNNATPHTSTHTHTHTQNISLFRFTFGISFYFLSFSSRMSTLKLVEKHINNEYIQWIRWHAMEWIDACARCRSGLTASAPLQTHNRTVPLLFHPIYLSLFRFAILEWSGMELQTHSFPCTRRNGLGQNNDWN